MKVTVLRIRLEEIVVRLDSQIFKNELTQKNSAKRQSLYQVLTFFLGQEHYAIPLSAIREVNRIADLKKIPKGPDYLVGFINLHGKTVPVLNLKSLIHLTPVDLAPKTMWCAVWAKDSLICLAVDRLAGFMGLAEQVLDPVPEVAGSTETRYLKWYARLDNSLMPVLEVTNLLSDLRLKIMADICAENGFAGTGTERIGKEKETLAKE